MIGKEYLKLQDDQKNEELEKGSFILEIFDKYEIMEKINYCIEKDFSNYSELLDLNIGKCKFCLASNSNYKPETINKRIATKYPKIAEQYFKVKQENVEIVKLNGSVELRTNC